MNELTTTAMVLIVMPIGEYDRRVELLSADLGRISAFARGARKPGSSLISVTRVFAFGTFTLYQGKSAYSLHSAHITRYFDELTANMDHIYFGFYFLEVAQYFTRENLRAEEELKLLYYSLRALDKDALDDRLVKSIFELKMLVLAGLCPPRDRLAVPPERPAPPWDNYIDGAISPGCLRALTHVIGMPVEKLYSFALTPEVQDEFTSIITRMLRFNVDKEFKSEKMLEPI